MVTRRVALARFIADRVDQQPLDPRPPTGAPADPFLARHQEPFRPVLIFRGDGLKTGIRVVHDLKLARILRGFETRNMSVGLAIIGPVGDALIAARNLAQLFGGQVIMIEIGAQPGIAENVQALARLIPGEV